MPAIRLAGFLGAVPFMNAAYLPDHNAADARNMNLRSPTLRAIKNPLEVAAATTSGDPATIFLYDTDVWFEWTVDADVVRSPVSNESYGRTYFTKNDGPWVTDSTIYDDSAQPYPSNEYRPGVPTPSTKPSLALSGSGSGTAETRYYVYCVVNEYGEIGPPSPVSDSIDVLPGEDVDVTLTSVADGAYNPVDKYYIYRSNSIGSGFQFVGETATTSFTDDVDVLGEALPSTDWDPPNTTLQGFTSVSNGIVAAFRGNEYSMCEPGLPHAWPVQYRYPVDYDIVALAAVDNGFAVLTEGQPYLVLGIHPSSMAPVRLEEPYACLSKNGVAQFGQAVVYPSASGLVMVDNSGARLVSEHLFTADQWDDLRPSTFRAFNWYGRYAAFYTNRSGEQLGFAVHPLRPEDGLTTFYGISVNAAWVNPADGQPYIATGETIALWDGGASQRHRWLSKLYELPAPEPMTTAQVLATAYPVTLSVYRDEELQCSVEAVNDRPFRLPNARAGRRYQIEISSEFEVREAVVSPTMAQIARV